MPSPSAYLQFAMETARMKMRVQLGSIKVQPAPTPAMTLSFAFFVTPPETLELRSRNIT